MLRKILNNLYKASGYLSAFFLMTICLLVIVQVGFNSIDRISTLTTGSAIGLTIPSYADFTGFFLAASSFLALAYTMRSGSHIRVTLIFSNLPYILQKILEGVCLLLASVITVYFTYYTGYLVYESFTYNDLSSGMIAIPIWIPQSTMFLGLAVLAISLIDDLFCHLLGKNISFNQPHAAMAEKINE
ncbi:MAG: TRAP transporter small permease [Desulfotalea sp.]